MSVTTRGFTFVAYSATLDVPRHLGEFLARHLAAQRRRIATPQGSRALGPYRQVVRVLRWFRERGGVHTPIKRSAGQVEGALHVDLRMYNALLRHVRALGERTAAELK